MKLVILGRMARLRNDLYCVEWGVKLYSLTHLGRMERDTIFTPKSNALQ